jgi:hypothetical protein
MTYLLTSVLVLAFPLVSILAFTLLTGYNAHTLNPNHLTQGFSNCYIELVLFSETQEFQASPQIPVTVSFSKTIKDPRYEGTNNTGKGSLCNEVDCFPRINCVAIFLLLAQTAQSQSEYSSNTCTWTRAELRTVLCRYFWIFQCPHPIYHPASVFIYRLFHRNTYVVAFQDLSPTVRFDKIFSDHEADRLPMFYYALRETHIELSIELTSPCHFQVSKDLLLSDIRQINVKSAFDGLYSFGQRTRCSALQWRLRNYYLTIA